MRCHIGARRVVWISVVICVCLMFVALEHAPAGPHVSLSSSSLPPVHCSHVEWPSILHVSASMYVSPLRVRIPESLLVTALNVTGLLRVGDSATDVGGYLRMLQQQITAQQSTIQSQAALLQTLSDDLLAMAGRMAAVEAAVNTPAGALTVQIAQISSDVAALQKADTGSLQNLTALTARVAAAETSQSSLRNDVSSLDEMR
jgi:septal ring factor EnvC (AmiA/AmiB activator)